MDIKLIIQIFFLIIIIFIIFFVYIFFFEKKEDNKTIKINENDRDVVSIDKNTSNIIKNIEYYSKDNAGNEYTIKAELGEIDPTNTDIIIMTNVSAFVILSNSEVINIKSESAIYNKLNYETNFSGNVILNYILHEIFSDNLDLFLNKNTVSISNNIIYKYPGTVLETDRIEIDLTTKDTKIFMLDENEKISIKSNKE